MKILNRSLLAGAIIWLISACNATASDTQSNKQLVLDFYAALDEADANNNIAVVIERIADKFLSDNYTQMSEELAAMPGKGSDKEKFIAMFQRIPSRPEGAPAPPKPKLESIMAEGNKVMLLTSRPSEKNVTGKVYIFNMFTVEDNKLVSHWFIAGMNRDAMPAENGK